MQAFGEKIGNLAQGDEATGIIGTDTIVFLTRNEIENIPSNRTVTYLKVVADYMPQKQDPNRMRIMFGGNLINYPRELTTRTADMMKSKLLWKSLLSTRDARYMIVEIKGFYLNTPLDRYEYMKMPIAMNRSISSSNTG